MKNILVIVATYNGEKFIKEQIDSIINQKIINSNLYIKIYDDGSKDNTLEILKNEYSEFSNIEIIKNKENKGYSKNFLDAIKENANKYDYIALSDQDDVWDFDKLYIAIQNLEEGYNLYFSNVRVTDEKLNYIRDNFDDSITYAKPYIKNICQGCTIVLDKNIQNEFIKNSFENIFLHDHYIYLIAKYKYKCLYDKTTHMDYRQHNFNQIGSTKKRKKVFNKIKDFYKFTFKKNVKKESYLLQRVIEQLNLEKNNETKEMFNLAYYKKNKIKILFGGKYKKDTFTENLQFKLRIIFNKF